MNNIHNFGQNYGYAPHLNSPSFSPQAASQQSAFQQISPYQGGFSLPQQYQFLLLNLLYQVASLLQSYQQPPSSGANQFHGTNGNDLIHGTSQNDAIYGYSGSDHLFGHHGEDLINGGFGNDSILGGTGADTLIGGRGNDFLDGGEGHDTAVFSGNLEDYEITLLQGAVGLPSASSSTSASSQYGVFEHLVVKNKETGEVDSIAINRSDDGTLSSTVESLQFADTTVNADDYLNVVENPDLQALNDNRQKFNETGFALYDFQLERSAFTVPEFLRPIVTTVNGDGTASSRFADDGQAVPVDYPFANQSINDVFNIIEEAINNGAHDVNVTYDEQFGYPTSVSIDYDERIADEELFLNISQFHGALV